MRIIYGMAHLTILQINYSTVLIIIMLGSVNGKLDPSQNLIF